MSVQASVPEPAPVKKGEVVPQLAIEWIYEHVENRDEAEKCVQLIKERDAFGQAKYGQPLMTEDGRNTIEDARQELGDALQYGMKALYNKEDLSSLLPDVNALRDMIFISMPLPVDFESLTVNGVPKESIMDIL